MGTGTSGVGIGIGARTEGVRSTYDSNTCLLEGRAWRLTALPCDEAIEARLPTLEIGAGCADWVDI